MTDDDLIARLRRYNPPDRTVDEQRQIAVDIHEAADRIEQLQRERDCSRQAQRDAENELSRQMAQFALEKVKQ